MKKLFIFNILVLIFITVSCSNSKPTHLIVGKWQAENHEKVIFTFDENNLLETSINGRTFNHKYFVVDEKTVSFSENVLDKEKRENYKFKLINNNEFQLKCEYQGVINGKSIVDAPELCSYSSFKRMQ
jgi:hypothetical protein